MLYVIIFIKKDKYDYRFKLPILHSLKRTEKFSPHFSTKKGKILLNIATVVAIAIDIYATVALWMLLSKSTQQTLPNYDAIYYTALFEAILTASISIFGLPKIASRPCD